MKSTLRIITFLFFACSVAAIAAPTGAQTTRSLTVTPDSNLVGGDVVTLQGSGFAPSATIYFCQAVVAGTPDQSDCGVAYGASSSNEAGEFSATYTVQRFVTPASAGTTIDCADPNAGCLMAASDDPFNPNVAVLTPLVFVPQPPVTSFSISGTVTDSNGDPVLGAYVWAYVDSDPWVGSIGAITDANGSYALEGVVSNVGYRILFFLPNSSTLIGEWYSDQPTRQAANVVRLTLNTPDVQANAQLSSGTTISGSVTDSTGAPLAGIVVRAYGPGDTLIGRYATTTAADGTFSMAGVRPDQYLIRFGPPAGSGHRAEWFDDAPTRGLAESVSVPPGQGVSGIDAALASSP